MMSQSEVKEEAARSVSVCPPPDGLKREISLETAANYNWIDIKIEPTDCGAEEPYDPALICKVEVEVLEADPLAGTNSINDCDKIKTTSTNTLQGNSGSSVSQGNAALDGFICELCNKKFQQRNELVQHLLVHGLKPGPRQQKRPRTYKGYDKMKFRERNKKNLETRAFECSYCFKTFGQSSNLVVHLRTHTGESPYECTLCNKTCKTSGNLKIHMRFHTGDKPYECEVCKKRFISKSHLNRHAPTHTGERNFECPTCNKRFKNTTHLGRHKKTHGLERPFECPTCGKRFKVKGHLTEHMYNLHERERNFGCAVCSKVFKREGLLRKHMVRHPDVLI